MKTRMERSGGGGGGEESSGIYHAEIMIEAGWRSERGVDAHGQPSDARASASRQKVDQIPGTGREEQEQQEHGVGGGGMTIKKLQKGCKGETGKGKLGCSNWKRRRNSIGRVDANLNQQDANQEAERGAQDAGWLQRGNTARVFLCHLSPEVFATAIIDPPLGWTKDE